MATTIRARTSRQPLSSALTRVWRSFCRDAFDPYRPELHYMRGPGPKWRAKHGTKHGTAAMRRPPALVPQPRSEPASACGNVTAPVA